MKKSIVFGFLLMVSTLGFTQGTYEKLINEINKSDLFTLHASEVKISERYLVTVKAENNEAYVRSCMQKYNVRFEDKKSVTLDDILNELKQNKSIYNEVYDFTRNDWKNYENVSFHVLYTSLGNYHPIKGAGRYTITIFEKDYVITVDISDNVDTTIRNDDYDKLWEYVYFRKNESKVYGELNNGYFFYSDKEIEQFYSLLKTKDKKLPRSALNFLKAEEKLEKLINGLF